MDMRSEFIVQWYKRSKECADEFERFIFLYICFIVMIKGWSANNSNVQSINSDSDDGVFVDKYFSSKDNLDSIISICENAENFKILVKRKGDQNYHIVDSNNPIDQVLFKDLYLHYNSNSIITVKNKSRAIGKILKVIRNNLFHGGKLYNSSRDIEILEIATPILEKLLIHGAQKELHVNFELIE